MSIKENGKTTYTTQDRKYVAKEQMLGEMFETTGGIRRIIESSSDPYADPRLDALLMYFMTYALDFKTYTRLMNDRDAMLDELDALNLSSVVHNKRMFRVNMRMIAHCMESFDNFIGFKKKQVIMTVKDGETAKYANELDGTYSAKMFAKGEPCCTDPDLEGDGE